MADIKNKGGRPSITEQEKMDILHKLEPYLKTGLSINKALSEAKIPSSTFYKLMKEDEKFVERINTFRNFVAILTNNALIKQLMVITTKQNPPKGHEISPLNKEDIKFLQWVALNSNLMKDEWGERKTVDMPDPEAEIQKIKAMLEESTTEEILHN